MPKIYSDEQKEHISNRLKTLRIQNQLTQTDFLELFEKYTGQTFRKQTVSAWEHLHPPRTNTIYKLAEFYHTEVFDIMGEEAQKSPDKIVKLSKENAKLYNGEPVWCIINSKDDCFTKPMWGIIDTVSGSIVFSKNRSISFKDIDFEIYRRPFPFSYGIDAFGEPMTENEIKSYKGKLWVEPVGGSYLYRQNGKGWGTYSNPKDIIIMESGHIFEMKYLYEMFMCFKEPCEYKAPEELKITN